MRGVAGHARTLNIRGRGGLLKGEGVECARCWERVLLGDIGGCKLGFLIL